MNMSGEYGGEDVSNVTRYRAKRHVASHGTGLASHVLAGPGGPKPLLANAVLRIVEGADEIQLNTIAKQMGVQ